jgi:hypothetical protein
MLVILRSRIIFSGSGEISEAHLKNLNLYDWNCCKCALKCFILYIFLILPCSCQSLSRRRLFALRSGSASTKMKRHRIRNTQ